MEKNTVILTIEMYDELIDFKKNYEKGNTIIIRNGIPGWNCSKEVCYITKEESVKNLTYYNFELEKQIRELQDEIKVLKSQKQFTLDNIKKMSYYKFYKLRKS